MEITIKFKNGYSWNLNRFFENIIVPITFFIFTTWYGMEILKKLFV